jgi:hypothetical protein
MRSRVAYLAILLATVASAAVAVGWADGEFQRVEPPSEIARPVPRPDWVWAMNRPYRRFQFDWTWVCVAATVGMGAVVARGPSRPPGTIVVIVALLVGVVTVGHYLLTAPAIFRTNGDCYGLHNALQVRMPGAILGAWVVTWGRKSGWRGRLIGGIWMVPVAMLVVYGILFG